MDLTVRSQLIIIIGLYNFEQSFEMKTLNSTKIVIFKFFSQCVKLVRRRMRGELFAPLKSFDESKKYRHLVLSDSLLHSQLAATERK